MTNTAAMAQHGLGFHILSSLPEPVLALAPNGTIGYANGAAEVLLGRSARRLIGREVGKVICFADARMNQMLARPEGTLTAQNMDLLLPDAEHGAQNVDVSLAPVENEPGWYVLALLPQPSGRVLQSARDRAGEQAALGAPSILSHEIKNPLAGIKGAAQLLAKTAEQKALPLIKLIVTEVDRIARIIDQIQHLGSRRPPKLEASNIHVLLDRAIQSLRAANPSPPSIRINFDPSLPDVIVDPDAMLQILINLLQNACDALRGTDNPEITISTRFLMSGALKAPVDSHGERPVKLPVEVTLSDNGPGVPEAIADELFSPFVTSKRDGQGLGLAIVQKLMRDMNGRVTHERDRDAGLTQFRLLLPITDWRQS